MSNLREAAQQALEAIDYLDSHPEGGIDEAETAIEALRAALAQPEPAAPTVVEPEPVAWMWQHEETGHTGFVSGSFDRAHFEKHNPRLKIIAPCYRHPPRTALTDTEIDALLPDSVAHMNTWEACRLFARSIEAALKEKNHE